MDERDVEAPDDAECEGPRFGRNSVRGHPQVPAVAHSTN